MIGASVAAKTSGIFVEEHQVCEDFPTGVVEAPEEEDSDNDEAPSVHDGYPPAAIILTRAKRSAADTSHLDITGSTSSIISDPYAISKSPEHGTITRRLKRRAEIRMGSAISEARIELLRISSDVSPLNSISFADGMFDIGTCTRRMNMWTDWRSRRLYGSNE